MSSRCFDAGLAMTPDLAGDRLAAALQTAAALARPLEELPDPLVLTALPGPFGVVVKPPGSKSLTNRALVIAALAEGETVLRRPLLDAQDAELMIAALRRFGATIREFRAEDGARCLRVRGVGGRPRGAGEIHVGNAGTVARFLSGVAALADGPTVIDGSERMRQRPIGGLASALRALRVRVDFLGEYGYPPLRITPSSERALTGGALHLSKPPSSQFISALLMIAPWTRDGMHLTVDEEVTSPAYVRMTLDLLRRLGAADVRASDDLREVRVGRAPLEGFRYDVEPDASSATYFWAAAAITPGSSCSAPGLSRLSLQGDAWFPEALERMGALVRAEKNWIVTAAPPDGADLRPTTCDLASMPDTAMTLAAAACFARGTTTITGLETLKVKETDRLAATQTELRKIGVQVSATDDSLTISPPLSLIEPSGPDGPPSLATFDTYNDHRMAMSLALIGLRRGHVAIRDPLCVAKTYPTFWRDLARVYAASAAGPGLSDE